MAEGFASSRRRRDTAPEMIDQLSQIGCWCPKIKGNPAFQGTPLGDWDKACKTLSRCLNGCLHGRVVKFVFVTWLE